MTRRVAGAVSAIVVIAACSHNNRADLSPAALARRGATLANSEVWFLGLAGTSPSDTTVTFPAASSWTVVMRHGPPDNAIFAILQFPAASLTPATGDSAHLALRVLPGRFGVEISTPDRIGPGVTLTFSYAIHFSAPTESASRYPTPGVFEQALIAARVGDSTHVTLVRSERPATDMIRLPVTASGTYLLAALR